MALLKVERHVIRAAKKAACPAFLHGSRIDVPMLKRWLAKRKKTLGTTGKAKGSALPLPDLSTIEQSLAGAIEVEAEALGAVRAARARGDFAAVRELTAAHGLAQRNRREAEKTITELRVRRGQLMDSYQFESQLRRLWLPMVTLLRSLPRKLSAKDIPTDEPMRERVFDAEIESLIAEMRRSLHGEADPGFHLNVFMSATMQAEGLEKLMAKLEAARQSVANEIARHAREAVASKKKKTP